MCLAKPCVASKCTGRQGYCARRGGEQLTRSVHLPPTKRTQRNKVTERSTEGWSHRKAKWGRRAKSWTGGEEGHEDAAFHSSDFALNRALLTPTPTRKGIWTKPCEMALMLPPHVPLVREGSLMRTSARDRPVGHGLSERGRHPCRKRGGSTKKRAQSTSVQMRHMGPNAAAQHSAAQKLSPTTC